LLSALDPGLTCRSGAGKRLSRAAAEIAWYEGLERDEGIERWLVPLGLLLVDSRPRTGRAVVERLRPARRAARLLERCRDSVRKLLARLSRHARPSPSAIHRACADLEVETLLVAIAAARRPRTRDAIRRHLERQRGIRLEISGRDLVRAGVPAGPAVARGLRAALEARLDGRAAGAEAQLRHALRAAKRVAGPA
jgi:tRNA nucleotidyltransferase (CCA-adding enzyme)